MSPSLATKNKLFTFEKDGHRYFLDGRPMTGVTTVLRGVFAKDNLIQWAADQAIKYIKENSELNGELLTYEGITDALLELARTAHRTTRDKAGTIGTDVHSECETIIKDAIETGGFIQGTKHPNRQVQNFLNWAIENKVQFLSSETPVYSEEWFVAGTPDFTCLVEGKKLVGDLKTSNGIYDRTFFLQTAAYRKMLEEQGETDFAGSVIVRCGKDGSFETKYSYALEDDLKGFEAALTLYRIMESYKI